MGEEEGVIVGTSQRQAWLLPWWWIHYRMHNHHPVTFVDFGDLSEEVLKWCEKKGHVERLELPEAFMAKKEEVDFSLASLWLQFQPNLWELRFTWFKKPFSLLLTPYQRTLWLDLDCQVRGSIQPCFGFCENEGGFSVAPEHPFSQALNLKRNIIKPGEVMYNAGVVVYKKDSKIVKEWANRSKIQNHLHCSDQQLLASILNSTTDTFTPLNPLYNWTNDLGLKEQVVIYHHWGDAGKVMIKRQIELMVKEIGMNLTFKG